MKKKIYLSVICALAVNLVASDLGMIQVESSTINDKSESIKSEVSNVAVVTEQDVEKLNPHSVTEILNTIPGVTFTNSGTDSLKVHIRGIENQMYMGERPGVAIVIDGVSVQETSGKINVDLDNIASIKVIKGGASYLYGNDAIGGAVIITTKKLKGKSSSKIETEAGSFNSKRFSASTNQNFENSALRLQGSFRDSDGYWDDAFVTVKSVNGKYQYYINDTSDITFGLDYTKRETGDGNSVQGTSNAETNPTSIGEYSYSGYYDTELIKGFLTYSNDIGDDSNIMVRLHKYEDDKSYMTARTTGNKNEIWNQNGAKTEYKTSFDKLAVMAGLDIQRNSTDELKYDTVDGTDPRGGGSDGDLLDDYETQEDINALYTEVIYQPIKDLTTTFNLRYDNIKLKYIDNDDNLNNVNPSYNVASYRAGLNYKLSKNNNIYSSVSTGFRTPTVGQTSVNQVALKDDPTLDIPSEIDVETTYNYEVGIRGKVSTLSYDASIYQLDRKDYIGRIAGSYITSDDEDESNYDNVGDMRTRGFELALNSNKEEQLSFDLAYTYLDAKYTTYFLSQQLTENTARYGSNNAEFQRVDLSGNYVPRTSKHTANLRVNYKPTPKLTITPELTVKSSYYADEINANKQEGFEVVNLRANYEFENGLELFGKIDNLLDTEYYQFVNINSSALATMEEDATIRVAPPRAFYAGLRYIF